MWSRLFVEDHSVRSARHRSLSGLYIRIITLVEFLAAVSFVIGSVFFFYAELQVAGTWLFLIGSIFFCVSPMLRVVREFHLARLPQPVARAVDEEA